MGGGKKRSFEKSQQNNTLIKIRFGQLRRKFKKKVVGEENRRETLNLICAFHRMIKMQKKGLLVELIRLNYWGNQRTFTAGIGFFAFFCSWLKKRGPLLGGRAA